MTHDWTTAPDRATHHAHDKNGDGFYYEAKPILGDVCWWARDNGWGVSSNCTLPAGQDWRQSLVTRPKA